MNNNLVQNLVALTRLPDTWKVSPFQKIVKDASGGNKKILKSDFLTEGEFAIVDQGQDAIAGYTNNRGLLVKSLPPYVVFGDHTRIFKYVDLPFAMGADGTKVLKPKADGTINEKFLYFFFLTLNIPNAGYSRHFKYLKNTKIPLPPLPEQQKIAEILDTADSLRQKDQQLIDHYTELSKSLFLEMFGDLKHNEKNLDVVTIGDIVSEVKDGPHVSPKYSDTGIPILSTRNIRPSLLVMDEVKHVSNTTHLELTKRFKPKKGDVLLTKGGTTGYAKLVDFEWEFCIWVHIAALRPINTLVNPKYLESALNSHYCYQQSLLFTKGIANKDLGLKRIVNISLLLPPIELQNQFAERIEAIEQQKQQAQASLEKSEALFNSLLQRAFKGELTH